MPRKRLTGLSGGIGPLQGGVQWEYVRTNAELARRVIDFLEDKRVLTEHYHREDYDATRESADKIRNFLTMELMNEDGGGDLADALKWIRTACKNFITAAGPDSRDFERDQRYYESMLRGFREAVGEELGHISEVYGVPLHELAAIVPRPRP